MWDDDDEPDEQRTWKDRVMAGAVIVLGLLMLAGIGLLITEL